MANLIETSFARLDSASGQLPLADIVDWFGDYNLTVEDLANYLIFRPERYVRNLLRARPHYQALVICWRNGQRSPIHNHRGSHCGVKVLRGVATETHFARAANGLIYATGSHDLTTGMICASSNDDVHQISNLQAGSADLVTLHIYSPPLLRMDMYALDSPAASEWDDPINDPFGAVI